MFTALRDLKVMKRISSDLKNNVNEEISFRHSAAIKIRDLSATSNALMNLKKWNSSRVRIEIISLFDDDVTTIRALILFSRIAILKRVKRVHESMKNAELATCLLYLTPTSLTCPFVLHGLFSSRKLITGPIANAKPLFQILALKSPFAPSTVSATPWAGAKPSSICSFGKLEKWRDFWTRYRSEWTTVVETFQRSKRMAQLENFQTKKPLHVGRAPSVFYDTTNTNLYELYALISYYSRR